MNKILTIALFLGLAFTASAQDINLLKIQRFDPTVAAGPAQQFSWTTSATLKSGTTDTTEWFSFNSPGAVDTLLEAVVGVYADSMDALITAQYGTNSRLIASNVADSIKYNSPAAGAIYNFPAKGKALWFTRPAGATQVRLIIKLSATGNEAGLATQSRNKTYWAGIATRIKK